MMPRTMGALGMPSFLKKQHERTQAEHDEHVVKAVLHTVRTEDAQDHHRTEHHVVGDVADDVGIARSQDAEAEHEELGQEHADDEGIGDVGIFREQFRSGEQALDQQAAQQDGCRGTAGDGKGQQGDAGGSDRGVVGAFAAQTPSGIPGTEAFGVLVHLLHLVIGHQARHLSSGSGDDAR